MKGDSNTARYDTKKSLRKEWTGRMRYESERIAQTVKHMETP